MRDHDVIILGGGPAGLCAGLYTARAKLNAVLFEKLMPGGEILNTDLVEDYPGFERITGQELAQKFENHARKFGLNIQNQEVLRVYRDEPDVVVETDNGTFRAGAVIACVGGEPRKLGCPGEAEYAARGVSYCALCDGPFFQDETIAVVGGGNSALDEGLFLTKYAEKVYIVHRRDQFRGHGILVEEARDNPKVEFILDTVVREIWGDGKSLQGVTLRNVKTEEERRLEVGGVFIFIGFIPRSHIFRDGIKTDEGGFIITDDHMSTSIPGVFACGDVRSQLIRQITNAVGDATTAAVAAERYLKAQGTRERSS